MLGDTNSFFVIFCYFVLPVLNVKRVKNLPKISCM